MTFAEAKARSDYKFTPVDNCTLQQIRNGQMKYMNAEGDPIWGAAVLELGFIDIELNITAPCIYDIDQPDNKTPVLEYFCCLKQSNDPDDWVSFGYLDEYVSSSNTQVDVNWKAENWVEILEQDMFQTLDWLRELKDFSYDKPNILLR